MLLNFDTRWKLRPDEGVNEKQGIVWTKVSISLRDSQDYRASLWQWGMDCLDQIGSVHVYLRSKERCKAMFSSCHHIGHPVQCPFWRLWWLRVHESRYMTSGGWIGHCLGKSDSAHQQLRVTVKDVSHCCCSRSFILAQTHPTLHSTPSVLHL